MGRRAIHSSAIRLLQKIIQRILDRRLRRVGGRRIKGFDLGNGVFENITLADSHSLRGVCRDKLLLDRRTRFRINALAQFRRLVRLRIDRLFQYRYKIRHSVLPGFRPSR